MEPSTVMTGVEPRKPKKRWTLIVIGAGAIGAMSSVAAGGHGTYDITPFRIELRAKPAFFGKTEFAVRPLTLHPGHAEAGTHAAPIVLRATITDISPAFVTSDRKTVATPHAFAAFMGQEGKDAVRAFAIKLALLALAGGAAGGAAVSFGRWKRIVGGALAGLLTFAIIGLLIQQTYNSAEFLKTRYVLDRASLPAPVPSAPGGVIPSI